MAEVQGRAGLGAGGSGSGGESDTHLLEAIAAQDENALQTFYKRHASTVHAFAMRRLNLTHIADEITNDTFVQVWRSAKNFRQNSSGKTWLLSIAKHKVMDALRTQYRTAQNEPPAPECDHDNVEDTAPGPYAQVLSRQKGTHLANCFEALSPDHRECLHLSFVEGLTLNEISEVVDAPANTVGTRIHHAKHKLKACMEACLGVGEVV